MPIQKNNPRYGNVFACVSTFDELRALKATDLRNDQLALVEGGLAPGDRNGGLFVWVFGSDEADDNNDVFMPNGFTGGRWVRLGEGRGAKGERGAIGAPGGNVMAVGLFTELPGLAIPNGTNRIATTGFRKTGVGAADLYLWDNTLPALDATQQGVTWTTSDGGSKQWYLSTLEGSPEQVGAYADDGAYAFNSVSHGTDDWAALKVALSYFSTVKLTGKYYVTKTLNVKRAIRIEGLNGFEAGAYDSRVRFARGCVGFFFHRGDTNADDYGVPIIQANGNAADGFVLSRVEIVMGLGDKLPWTGTPSGHHAIWFKCRGVMQNLRIRGAAGHGIYCYASGDSTDPMLRGNTNGFVISGVRIEGTGSCGMFLNGPNCNAGLISRINTNNTGGPGIWDSSYLGNQYDALQTANAGMDGFCRYNGYVWRCADPVLAPTQEPGTGLAWKRDGSTSSTDLTWVSGARTYQIGWAGMFDDANAFHVLNNPYNEGSNFTFMGRRTVRIGGSASTVGEGLSISGTNISAGPDATVTMNLTGALTTRFSATGTYPMLTLHNNGSANSGRGTGTVMQAGYEADGTTPHIVGAIYGVSTSSSLTAKGRLQFLVGDGAGGLQEAAQFDGPTLSMRPGADNTWTLDTAALRMKDVYSASGTINTSDARHKQNVAAIPDLVLDAWGTLDWQTYQFDWAIAKKGNAARWHLGVIAQQVQAAFAAAGLDPLSFGLLCYDEWEAEYDDQGELIRAAGDLWGIRYEEALVLEAAYQRRRADRMEARLAAIEAQLAS